MSKYNSILSLHHQEITSKSLPNSSSTYHSLTFSNASNVLQKVFDMPNDVPIIAIQQQRPPPSTYSSLSSNSKQSLLYINSTSLHLPKSSSRNQKRIADEISNNELLLGKCPEAPNYLPTNLHLLLPRPIIIDRIDSFHDHQMIVNIKSILATESPMINKPPFVFELSIEAARKNSAVIRQFDCDLDAILHLPHSICTPGSEFRDPSILHSLLWKHPLWVSAAEILTKGAHMQLLHHPSDEQRKLENEHMIAYSNHQKAKLNPTVLNKGVLDDIKHGFTIPIEISLINELPYSMVCPYGLVEQTTISETGDRIPKLRITHDQTFAILPESKSLNQLTDLDTFPILIYGSCLQRIIHSIISLRLHYPTDKILVMKFDLSKAYRRIHYNWESAQRCITVYESFALLQQRLSFGGSACPSVCCNITEIIADLTNDILDNEAWHPNVVQSSEQHLVPSPIRLQDDLPYEPALPTMLLPNPKPNGTADVFIDDIIVLFIDSEETTSRAPSALPLAIQIFERPIVKTEIIPREGLLAKNKLAAEGAPSEIKIILGWEFNLRALTVHLPSDKHTLWSQDISKLMFSRRCTKSELQQLVGRLIHASTMIPLSRFYLGRFYKKIYQVKYNKSIIYMNNLDITLLQLWQKFLTKARSGINLNLLSYRYPTNITLSDSCPTGMGGYSLLSGNAWRFDLSYTKNLSNNHLEFLASVVTILIEDSTNHIPAFGHVLALTDNSSCVAWLHKNNFDPPTDQLPFEIATKLATCGLEREFTIHPQHIKGLHNNVSDLLSRRFTMSNTELTEFIHSNFSSQIPPTFKIYPIPQEILCWISSILAQEQPSPIPKPNHPMNQQTEPGVGGLNFSACQASAQQIHSSMPLTQAPNLSLQNASSKHSDQGSSLTRTTFIQRIQNNFLDGVLNKPLATWVRNSGVVVGTAPFTSKTDRTSSILPSLHYSKPGPA